MSVCERERERERERELSRHFVCQNPPLCNQNFFPSRVALSALTDCFTRIEREREGERERERERECVCVCVGETHWMCVRERERNRIVFSTQTTEEISFSLSLSPLSPLSLPLRTSWKTSKAVFHFLVTLWGSLSPSPPPPPVRVGKPRPGGSTPDRTVYP